MRIQNHLCNYKTLNTASVAELVEQVERVEHSLSWVLVLTSNIRYEVYFPIFGQFL